MYTHTHTYRTERMGWEWYGSLTCPELVAGMGGNDHVRWQLGKMKGWGWGSFRTD